MKFIRTQRIQLFIVRERQPGFCADVLHSVNNTEREEKEIARDKKTYGNLTIYDNGIDGLSYDIKYTIQYGWRMKDGIEYPLTEEKNKYGGITSDDMLDYTFEENIPSEYRYLTEEEKEFFEKEYFRIRRNAKHKEYYDPYDNTWKNYE